MNRPDSDSMSRIPVIQTNETVGDTEIITSNASERKQISVDNEGNNIKLDVGADILSENGMQLNFAKCCRVNS